MHVQRYYTTGSSANQGSILTFFKTPYYFQRCLALFLSLPHNTVLMWKKLGESVLRNRFLLLALLAAATVFMGWQASKVQLSYEFVKAIPTDHPKYIAYQEFKKKFGEDGNLLVIGIQTNNLFQEALFNDYATLRVNLI